MANKSESDSGSKRKGPRAATPASQVRDRVRLEPGTAPAPRRKAVVLPKPDRVRTRWGEPPLEQALIFFYRGLHTMMNAGLPVTKSLEMLAAQCERRDLGDSLKAVGRAVERGQYLSDALRAHPYIFPKLHPALVRVGERTGSLLHVLERLSQSMEREQEVGRRLRAALIYPLFICLAAIAFVVLVPALIFPSLLSFFQGLNAPVPWYTKWMLSVLGTMSSPMFLAALALGGLLLWSSWTRWPEAWRGGLDRLPILGSVRQRRAAAGACRNLSLMYGAGLPILQALELAAEGCGGDLEEGLRAAQDQVSEGASLHVALKENTCMPPVLLQLVAAGEKSGQTAAMLDQGARFVEETLEEKINVALAALQPLILSAVGAWVGLLVLSVMAPLVNVVNQL